MGPYDSHILEVAAWEADAWAVGEEGAVALEEARLQKASPPSSLRGCRRGTFASCMF